MPCLKWHEEEIKTLPEEAKVLATSQDRAVQAMRWDPRAYSQQVHIELEQSTVRDWAKISEYETNLIEALGANVQKTLEAERAAHLRKIYAVAES